LIPLKSGLHSPFSRDAEEVQSPAAHRIWVLRCAKAKGKVMTDLFARASRFMREEDGPTAVEYAVMLALIVVVCIAAITTLGSRANCTFSNTSLNIAAGNSAGGS
jgi:pilus assembly protein Flp/PilA